MKNNIFLRSTQIIFIYPQLALRYWNCTPYLSVRCSKHIIVLLPSFETLFHDSYHIDDTTRDIVVQQSYDYSSMEERSAVIYFPSQPFGASSTTNIVTTAESMSTKHSPLDLEMSPHVSSYTNLTTVSTETVQLLPSTNSEFVLSSISHSSAGNGLHDEMSEVSDSFGSNVTNNKYSRNVVSVDMSEDNTVRSLSVSIRTSYPSDTLPLTFETNHVVTTTIVLQDVSSTAHLQQSSFSSLSTSYSLRIYHHWLF